MIISVGETKSANAILSAASCSSAKTYIIANATIISWQQHEELLFMHIASLQRCLIRTQCLPHSETQESSTDVKLQ